jgi:hypothetical protein
VEPNSTPNNDLQKEIDAQIGGQSAAPSTTPAPTQAPKTPPSEKEGELKHAPKDSKPLPTMMTMPKGPGASVPAPAPKPKPPIFSSSKPAPSVVQEPTVVEPQVKVPEPKKEEIKQAPKESNSLPKMMTMPKGPGASVPKPKPKPPIISSGTSRPSVAQKPPIIPQPPQPKVEPPKPEIKREPTPADDVNLGAVRTYKADVNTTVKGDKITTAKVLIAEQKEREKEEAREMPNSISNPVNKFKLGTSVVLVGLAVVAILVGSYMFLMPEPEQENNFPVVNNPAFGIDEQVYITVTDRSRNDILGEVRGYLNSTKPNNSITEIVLFNKRFEGSEEINEKLSVGSLFNLLEFSPPPIFTRNLSRDYVFGSFGADSGSKTFLLFKLVDFGSTYSSIFDYEKDMISDIRKIFGGFGEFDLIDDLRRRKVESLPQENLATSTATSTATTTPINDTAQLDSDIQQTQAVIDSYKNFVDIVLQNNDSRAILNENSEVLFYYTFIDREWLLIADETEILKEVKRRIREKNLVR